MNGRLLVVACVAAVLLFAQGGSCGYVINTDEDNVNHAAHNIPALDDVKRNIETLVNKPASLRDFNNRLMVASYNPPANYKPSRYVTTASHRTSTSSVRAASTTACPPGQIYSAKLGGCGVCAAGSYADAATQSCKACAAGTFNAAEGAAACKPCAAGSFNPWQGTSSCLPCPPRMTSAPGAAKCSAA